MGPSMGSMEPVGPMGPIGPMDLVGSGMSMMGGNLGGMPGRNEAMFKAALQTSSLGQHANSQLLLILAADLLQQFLVPRGYLAEIAERCGIRIDLGGQVPPHSIQVSLIGSVVANAMAAYFLQERALQH